MKNLRKLFVAITLTIVLAGTASAECPIPGEMSTPPCTSTQEVIDNSADQAPTTATIQNEVGVIALDVVIAGLENLLTVF